MYAPEARGRRDPPPEAKGRCLGLQAPGGRPPVHIQDLNTALFVSAIQHLLLYLRIKYD